MTIQLPNQEGEEIDQQQRLKGAWDPEAGVCKMSKNRGPKMSSGEESREADIEETGADCNLGHMGHRTMSSEITPGQEDPAGWEQKWVWIQT